MAVTRIFQSGFELQNLGYDGWSVNDHASSYYSYKTAAPTPNTGNACLELNRDGFITGSLTTPIGAISQMRSNQWIYVPTATTFYSKGVLLAGFWKATSTSDDTLNILNVVMDSSMFRVWPGNNEASAWTAPFTMIRDAWVPIGIDMYCHGVSGYVRIWYNGVQIMDISGDTLDLENEINFFAMSPYWNLSGLDTSEPVYVDDVSLWDTTGESVLATPPEYKKYHFIKPNGDGNYSQWMGSDGNQVNNYLQVDEIPPDDDTSYNYDDVSAQRDSYAMENPSLAGATPDAVIPLAVIRGDGATSNIQLFLRENSIDDDGASQAIGTAYTTIWERFPLDPGGAAWDSVAVDAVEAGVLVP